MDASPLSTATSYVSRWTAFTSQPLPAIDRSRLDCKPPLELLRVPTDLSVQPKLVEILDWSLQRPKHSSPATPWDLLKGLVPTEVPETAPSKKDDGSVRSRRSGSLDRVFPGLKAAKNEVKVACERLKSVKHKNDLERAASLKEQHEAEAETPATAECTSCFEDLPIEEVTRLTCNHNYCKGCLTTLIMTALQNESAFPPKCCLTDIPPETILVPLNGKQQAVYKAKAAEYSIPANRRWYCPNTACTKWIPPGKLQRNRMVPQKCPHCSIKICSICRAVAHQNEDCPQDFGLEATLDVAESEGWRRCYSCRTMVERQDGCRHITCKCGAQFCYICGARWRTCECTEADGVVRQALLRRQREQADATARAEADEVARAMAAVERLAWAEEERRRRRELQRQREEAELARLEQIRLQEEEQRRREEAEAERQYQEVLRLSLREEGEAMIAILCRICDHQRIALDDRHGIVEKDLIEACDKRNQQQIDAHEQLQAKIARNATSRLEKLGVKQEQETSTLTARQEEHEDDVFLQIQIHLRDKPNKESREKRLQEELRKQQESEMKDLKARHAKERLKIENSATMEKEGIERTTKYRQQDLDRKHAATVRNAAISVAAERLWFDLVTQRRFAMVGAHNRIGMQEHEAGHEPNGLTEDGAAQISALPPLSSQISQVSGFDEELSAYEIESSLFPTSNVNASQDHRPSVNTQSLPLAPKAPLQGQSTPISSSPKSQQEPHSSPATQHPGTYMPRHGNTYLCLKEGESSKPICFPPMAPPTPPDSPHPIAPPSPDVAPAQSVPIHPKYQSNSLPSSPQVVGKEVKAAMKRIKGREKSMDTNVSKRSIAPPTTPTSRPVTIRDNGSVWEGPSLPPSTQVSRVNTMVNLQAATEQSKLEQKGKEPLINDSERREETIPAVKKSKNPFKRIRQASDARS